MSLQDVAHQKSYVLELIFTTKETLFFKQISKSSDAFLVAVTLHTLLFNFPVEI